ncbi:MAG TPA: quinone oxidoreductase [Kofleriaceae bacterium]|nr:quinone oxidoreductase [Kofleriaceae bacterium]
MRAIRPASPGGPEQLTIVDAAPRPPGPGEARVRVAFAGVNYIDVYHRTGLYPMPAPIAIGLEGAGVVEEVGPDVELAEGARVAWCGVPGSYAAEITAASDKLVPVPDGVSLEHAAAAMLQGMTAHYLATSTFELTSGSHGLVHAAAGGVGLLLGQLARRAGATAIGTVSTDAKAEAARAAGYAHVIRYDRDDFVAGTRAFTGGAGVDVVYDSVGATTFERGLDCLRPRGLMVLFGASSGPVPPLDLQLLNRKGSLFVTRPKLNDYTATRAELLDRAGDVLGAIAAGGLRITIDRILPLADAGRAHTLLESRATSGKLLLACS